MDYEKLTTTNPQSRRLSHLPDVFTNILNLNLWVSIQKELESHHLNPHHLPRVNKF